MMSVGRGETMRGLGLGLLFLYAAYEIKNMRSISVCEVIIWQIRDHDDLYRVAKMKPCC